MKKKTLFFIFILIALIILGLFLMREKLFSIWLKTPRLQTVYEQNQNNTFPKTVIPIPEEEGYILVAYKDRHILELRDNKKILKSYTINIRRNLLDRSIWEDDQTPEGIFTIETMDIVSDPPWSRWMRLDTIEKAKTIYRNAYEDGTSRLSEFEQNHGSINDDQALREFNEINADQKILRGIGIHGGGFSLYHDWTLGCIAMNDVDIIELFDILQASRQKGLGTKVIIQD